MDSSYLFRIDELQVIDATLKVRALQIPLAQKFDPRRVRFPAR